MNRFAVALMLLLATPFAHAAACGTAGDAKVFSWKGGGGYLFQVYLPQQDLQLSFPGRAFVRGEETPIGVKLFSLDGIPYEVVTTPLQPLLDGLPADADEDAVLARHAELEVAALAKTESPLVRFEDFGTRTRPANGATPPLRFKFWRLTPRHGGDMSQYFATTIVGDNVVVLSALVMRSLGQEPVYLATLEHYATHLTVLTAQDCLAAP